MSDTEAVDVAPPPEEAPKGRTNARGRGRGGRRKGAGRGGKAATQRAAPKKPATTGGRRGRLKQFNDSRVQANYERQREIKAHFAHVAAVLKPVLQDLAERNIEQLTEDPETYKRNPGYGPMVDALDTRRNERLNAIQLNYQIKAGVTNKTFDLETRVINETFAVSFSSFAFFCLDSPPALHLHALPIFSPSSSLIPHRRTPPNHSTQPASPPRTKGEKQSLTSTCRAEWTRMKTSCSTACLPVSTSWNFYTTIICLSM